MSEDILNMLKDGKGISYIVNVITNPNLTTKVSSKINEIKSKKDNLELFKKSLTNDEGAFTTRENMLLFMERQKIVNESVKKLQQEVKDLEDSVYSSGVKCENITDKILDSIDVKLFGLENSMNNSNRIVMSNEKYYDNTNIYGNVTQYSAGLASVSLRDRAKSEYANSSSDYIKLNAVRKRLISEKQSCNGITFKTIQEKPTQSSISIGSSLIPLGIIALIGLRGRK